MTTKQQLIYLYSIKEQARQVLNILDGNEPISVVPMTAALTLLSDTIIYFNSLQLPQVPPPPDGQKPELKVIDGGNNSGGNVV